MQSDNVIREFETKNFRVIVDAVQDDYPDMSWDDGGEVQDKIDSGEYVLFCARARVIEKNTGAELASDYLGGCIYESLQAFMNHRECAAQTRELRAKGQDAICGSYFSDMVHNVCTEARLKLGTLKGLRIRT